MLAHLRSNLDSASGSPLPRQILQRSPTTKEGNHKPAYLSIARHAPRRTFSYLLSLYTNASRSEWDCLCILINPVSTEVRSVTPWRYE